MSNKDKKEKVDEFGGLLTKDQQKKYWQNKKQLAAEFLISAETEEQKNDCLKDIANADENLKGF